MSTLEDTARREPIYIVPYIVHVCVCVCVCVQLFIWIICVIGNNFR